MSHPLPDAPVIWRRLTGHATTHALRHTGADFALCGTRQFGATQWIEPLPQLQAPCDTCARYAGGPPARTAQVTLGDVALTVNLDQPADVLSLIIFAMEATGSPDLRPGSDDLEAVWELGDGIEMITALANPREDLGAYGVPFAAGDLPRYHIVSLTQTEQD